jgi:23S rRNA (guanosine2251-2'-O)-methyltransferase
MAQWIYGKNTVREALLHRRVKKIGILPSFSDATILALITEQHLPVERMSAQRLDDLAQGSHQGIIADIKPFSYTPMDTWLTSISQKVNPLVVMLDEVQDPQNLGAIIRNAVGLFADAIILKKHQQVEVTPTVMKIASGAIEHLAIIQVTNLSNAMTELKDKGFWIASTSLTDAMDYRAFDYRGPIAVIFGSEGQGVSPLVNQRADVRIRIPLSPKLESFNVASSVAIVLAEVYRQRFPLK